ncbi:MAG: type IV secretory system conjugative DNA transfer family protein [Muribaculaceae bacterium]|nr:type IV secretory system conjugative DNA transfer family protein [Muribaculaceae bacterium]
MINERILCDGYENMRLVRYDGLAEAGIKTVKFSELGNFTNDGVLKACFRDENGELVQLYTKDGNHAGIIAATRLGKTTSYVIPTVISFAMQKVKKSFIVSDPKGEIYRLTAETLKKQGYKIKLLNFRDCNHSEFWNPLTPIFRKYKKAASVYDGVETVQVDGEWKYKFNGKIYDDAELLNSDVEDERKDILDDVSNDIDDMGIMLVDTAAKHDPTWEDGVRDLFKAFLYAMLEDSEAKENPITEETFSFDTMFDIMSTFSDNNFDEFDNGYFSNRDKKSKAYLLSKPIILDVKGNTRGSYMSVWQTKFTGFMAHVTRKITSCNSFEIEELGEGPVALFLCYRDELRAHFKTITIFVQNAYKFLIEKASGNKGGKLEAPFYFILDEFGNFAPIKDFETTISACAGRNIWFILIVQSYAQLASVYNKDVSEIIRDNLNVHVFFGSNNPATLEEFSRECGQYTRISPLSAVNGSGAEIERYELETLPLVTKSRLSHFSPGECVVTEANCGYVLFSFMERYFMCEEFTSLPESDYLDYVVNINPKDKKYKYDYVSEKHQSGPSVF